MSATEPQLETSTLDFPSLEWFQRLADLMNANRARQEQLGYLDCTVGFRVLDAGKGGTPVTLLVRFEEFEALEVREAEPADEDRIDFTLEGTLSTWRKMVESIAAGGGRPALDQTLNFLTHMGEPLRVQADDPLQRDLYFRYNQSLQEFVNASAAFHTAFPGRG